jgi:OOP family OmpA-OmpF porin
MAASLLDQLTQLVTPDLVRKASAALGENEGGVTRGLGAALPMLLAGAATRSSDSGVLGQLFNLVQDPANDVGLVADPARLLGAGASASPAMGLGSRLLSMLFGGNVGALGNALAGHAGVRPQSASSLLAAAAPMVLGVLGKVVRGGGLTASSLGSLLSSQKSTIAAALPPGLNVERYLAEPARAAPAAVAAVPAAPARSIWRWLVPVLAILAALLLLSRCLKREEPAPEPTTTAPSAEVTPAPTAPAPETGAPAAATTATVYFDTGTATPPADAATTLQGVVDYLNANPTAVAVVSGYHDPTGDRAVNEELARNRATAVRDALVAAGIAETRIDLQKPIETAGEGSLEAARRVEVTVR